MPCSHEAMMEPEPLIAFLGIHLQPGKPVSSAQYLTDGSGVESTVCLHFTQATLGDKPKAGRTTIWVTHGKEKFALGTLETGRVELFSLDLMFVSDLSFTTSGVNDVYLTGYKCAQPPEYLLRRDAAHSQRCRLLAGLAKVLGYCLFAVRVAAAGLHTQEMHEHQAALQDSDTHSRRRHGPQPDRR